MTQPQPPNPLFDSSLYSSTWAEKILRSLQLGPKYYFVEFPRYLGHRRALGLSGWDQEAFLNPTRELFRRTYTHFDLPPGYDEALSRFRELGIPFALPQLRLEAVIGAWWASREVAGDVIECGAYRGATSLLIALLGRMNGLRRTTLVLDTFCGAPKPTAYDGAHQAGDFLPPASQVEALREQAIALGVDDELEIHAGLFADTFEKIGGRELHFAFVHVDANIYQSTLEACAFSLPRTISRETISRGTVTEGPALGSLALGSMVVFDDYNGVTDLGARLAIDGYLRERGVKPQPLAGCSAFLRF